MCVQNLLKIKCEENSLKFFINLSNENASKEDEKFNY